MRSVMLASLAFALLATGCTSQPAARGWNPSPTDPGGAKIGSRFTDFNFADQSGKERSLRRELGDYSVLAFTRCEADTHQPVNDLLEAILTASRAGNDNVKVVGVNVHWCEAGCKNSQHCHLIEAKPNTGSICDGDGRIAQLYSATSEDWLVVVGPDKTIEFSEPATRGAELSKQLKKRVDELSAERIRHSFSYR